MVARLQHEFHYLEKLRDGDWRLLESHTHEVEEVMGLLREIDRGWTYRDASQEPGFSEILKVFREAMSVMRDIEDSLNERVARRSNTLSAVLGVTGLLEAAAKKLQIVDGEAGAMYKRRRVVLGLLFLVVVCLLLLAALALMPADTPWWIPAGFVVALVVAYLIGRKLHYCPAHR